MNITIYKVCEDMTNADKSQDNASNDFGFGIDLSGASFPKAIVEKMLETNERLARQSGHDHEREDNVCRLLASGMSVEEISLVLKIRVEEIRIIESNNARLKIPEYTRTYKSRVKSRERSNNNQPRSNAM